MTQEKRATILLVDDNPTNIVLAQAVLGALGYRVHSVTSGEDVLVYLRELEPDLILMDIQLPGIDGLTLTRRLKADPETTQIPIIALTAYAMAGDEQRAREAGCDGYISKPFSPQTLADRVAQALEAPGGGNP